MLGFYLEMDVEIFFINYVLRSEMFRYIFKVCSLLHKLTQIRNFVYLGRVYVEQYIFTYVHER